MTTSLKKQHNKWQRELSQHWQQNPITTCEVRFPGCFQTYGLAPAHSLRRFKIKTKQQYFEVVAACQFCHRILDQQMKPDECMRTIKEIIHRRESQIDCF